MEIAGADSLAAVVATVFMVFATVFMVARTLIPMVATDFMDNGPEDRIFATLIMVNAAQIPDVATKTTVNATLSVVVATSGTVYRSTKRKYWYINKVR